jgi:hypothetical protein
MSTKLQEKLKRSSRYGLSQITPKRFCTGFMLQSARQYEATLTESPISLDNSNVSFEEFFTPSNSLTKEMTSLEESESDSETVVESTNTNEYLLETVLNRSDSADGNMRSTVASCNNNTVGLPNPAGACLTKSAVFRPKVSKIAKPKSQMTENEPEPACLSCSDSAAVIKNNNDCTITPSPVQLVPRMKPFTSTSVRSRLNKSLPVPKKSNGKNECVSSDDTDDDLSVPAFKCELCFKNNAADHSSTSQNVPVTPGSNVALTLAEKEERLRKLKLVKTYRTKVCILTLTHFLMQHNSLL